VRLQEAFDELARSNLKGLAPVFLDVTDARSIASAVADVRKNSGVLHGLINNAGIAICGPIEGLSLEDWHRQFETNLFGLVELTRLCLPLLRETKGRVLNISSVSGRIASPYLSPYSASKFALEGFSDSLRREMRRFGVHVALIEPGPLATPIWQKSVADADRRRKDLSEEVVRLYGDTIDRLLSGMLRAGGTAESVSVAVTAVEHALLARKPRTRYAVGKGIGFMTKMSNVLPDRWIDKLLQVRSRLQR
jgi:NAD(P)-dependent dehydrogenase (short-subunit alcohol dehydrogenase family)